MYIRCRRWVIDRAVDGRVVPADLENMQVANEGDLPIDLKSLARFQLKR